MTTEAMTYAGSGVDYGSLDPFKRSAQHFAAMTSGNAARLGIEAVEWTRGESVFVMKTLGRYMGVVEEGLGTKNLVADLYSAALRPFRHTRYADSSQDTVAMIVNDMITLGIWPAAVNMHLAVGDSAWFDDGVRSDMLLKGWKDACGEARCIWGGGETPTLKGIVEPGTCMLSGSAWGMTKEGQSLIDPMRIAPNDAIVLLASSGIHANGLTLARKIAGNHPEGYRAWLSDDQQYGDALLTPTHIYVGFIEDCVNAGVDFHYLVNVTGHGWRKLMRHSRPFSYEIGQIPEPQPVFSFIQEHGNVTDEEMYGNFNMGAGFAAYVSENDVKRMQEVMDAGTYPFSMLPAGVVKKSAEKRVIIDPKNLTYAADTLQVR